MTGNASSELIMDTMVLIWLAGNTSMIGPRAHAALAEGDWEGRLAYSVMSLWELGSLIRKSRIDAAGGLHAWRNRLQSTSVSELVVTGDIVEAADMLEDFHQDPADRLIVASALARGASLITSDRAILDWPGGLNRVDARL